uniref:Arginine kinase-like n=1 Tax=Diabrotica virgifera virgifera TaxID=50390 RepID=A0A6P7GIM6_DIAVI
MVDAAVLDKLESGFAKIKDSNSKSLLKKHLTQEIFDNLKTKKTPTFGCTLLDVIQSGKYLFLYRLFRFKLDIH